MKPRPAAASASASGKPGVNKTYLHLRRQIKIFGEIALDIRGERDALLLKMFIAREHLEQVIGRLTTDARGNPREPSPHERETVEYLRKIHEELVP